MHTDRDTIDGFARKVQPFISLCLNKYIRPTFIIQSMKKKLLSLIAIGAMLAGLTACNDNDVVVVDDQAPVAALEADHLRTEAGHSINVKGTLTDNDGLKSVELYCPDLFLKKTIDLLDIYPDSLIKTYNLDYTYKIERYNPADKYEIAVTVTDVLGHETPNTVLVTLDGDLTAPSFPTAPSAETTVLLNEGQDTYFDLEFVATDNVGLDYVQVEINTYDLATKELGESLENYPRTFDCYGEDTYEFSESVLMPEAGVYMVTITAYDLPAQNNEVRSKTVSGLVNVAGGVDFAKMYLADVPASELTTDVFGVPMRVDKVGECQYRARYYNEKANTEIYFLAQKGSYSPICYGIDPTDDSKLINSPGNVKPIVLPEAGKYYEINYNTDSGEYDFATYEVADYMNPIFYEYGSESFNVWGNFVPDSDDEYTPTEDAWLQPFLIGTGEKPQLVEPFVQDPTNKNVYMWEMPKTFAAGEQLNFMIHELHPAEWWNAIAWRVDDDVECEQVMYYGGVVKRAYLDWAFGPSCDWKQWNNAEDYRKKFVPDNWFHPTVQNAGTYQLYFDAHLGRAKLVPAK